MKNIETDVQMLQRQEAEFARLHKSDTDEELIAYLVKCSKELGRCPKKDEVIGHTYLKALRKSMEKECPLLILLGMNIT